MTIFSPPDHPLDILAATMDSALSNPSDTMRWTPSLWSLAAESRKRDGMALRASLSCLAAHMAVRNQVMLLGQHKVDEEMQTAALFGLLANALSMITILASGYTTSSVKKIPTTGCYWAHQKKRIEEPKTGGDFGIITDVGNGDVKLTLFQAKRPQKNQSFNDLRMTQIVHPDMPEPPKSSLCAWKQKEVLQEIKHLLAQGKDINRIDEWLSTNGDLWLDVINRGDNSLFVKNYRYAQSTALLATELTGWVQSGKGSWCYYVQWPYGEAECPWAISVITALGTDEGTNAIERSLSFADVLAQALSPNVTDIGLVIPFSEVNYWASTISPLMPGILWGGSDESAEGAASLVEAISTTPREIQRIDMQQFTAQEVYRNEPSGPRS